MSMVEYRSSFSLQSEMCSDFAEPIEKYVTLDKVEENPTASNIIEGMN